MSIEPDMKGTGVALVTPFTNSLDLDIAGLKKMVNYVIEGGVNYIVALGTTAETPVLSDVEKKEVVEAILSANSGRVPVILGMGGNNTRALEKSINEQDFTGISGILSVAPYYNKPTQEGIYQHFKIVAEISPVPVVLYNVPGRTSSNISADTCLRLANEFHNIIAIKEASGNMSQVMKILQNKPDGFELVSGDDALTLPLLSLGGAGVISVIANAFPREFSEMVTLGLENQIERARSLHYKLLPAIEFIFQEGNPAGVKACLKEKEIISEHVRLPLVEASGPLRACFSEYLRTF